MTPLIPEGFRLYDTLNYCATAVDEDGSGRPANAEAAWLEAQTAASGLFAAGSPESAAIAAILNAARPCPAAAGNPALWNALNAAALAVLPAMTGDWACADIPLRDATAAASLLPPGQERSFLVILAEIWRMARTGDEVTA